MTNNQNHRVFNTTYTGINNGNHCTFNDTFTGTNNGNHCTFNGQFIGTNNGNHCTFNNTFTGSDNGRHTRMNASMPQHPSPAKSSMSFNTSTGVKIGSGGSMSGVMIGGSGNNMSIHRSDGRVISGVGMYVENHDGDAVYNQEDDDDTSVNIVRGVNYGQIGNNRTQHVVNDKYNFTNCDISDCGPGSIVGENNRISMKGFNLKQVGDKLIVNGVDYPLTKEFQEFNVAGYKFRAKIGVVTML